MKRLQIKYKNLQSFWFYLENILKSELKNKAYDIFVEFNSNEEFVRFFAQFAEAPTYKKLLDFKSYIYDENEM